MDLNDFNLVKKLRHQLHQHPELSNEEIFTKAKLISFLKEHTKLEIVDCGKWFYAIYKGKNPQKKIGFRADFDAVPVEDEISAEYKSKNPGVGHKCGHDGHSAALVAFAMLLEKEGCNNDIYLIFQHAEETGDGAILCSKLADEAKLDEVYSYHNMPGYPCGAVISKTGTFMCASKGLEIIFDGIPTHASTPELGVNPAIAIAEIIQKIPSFISLNKTNGLVLCTVIQVDIGERAFGCSASKGKLLLTIRGQFEEELLALENSIMDFAKNQCEKYGLKYKKMIHDDFPETANHKDSVEKIKKACNKLNITYIDAKEAIRTSEDFGHFLKKSKGAMFYIGNGENACPLHSTGFDFPDEHIPLAIKIFYELSK